jgi:hypothetical protein
VPTKLDAANEKLEERIEQKFHPHSAFLTGFVRVLANLGVLVAWVVLAANLMAHDWVDNTLPAKAACVGRRLHGTTLWFVILSFGVSRGHGKFSEKTLLRLQHISGMCLIASALFEGAQIVLAPRPTQNLIMLKAGIVGLPNVGKSTLFNAVTRTRKAEAANYPFCTIDPNVGIVTVPDARLEPLANRQDPGHHPGGD